MKTLNKILFVIGATLAISANSQTGGGFLISKSTIDAGGGTSSGGSYSVSGSIGQADAAESLTGGGYNLTTGFWSKKQNSDIIFKQGFE